MADPISGTGLPVEYSDSVPASQTVIALDTATTSLVGANGQVFYFGTPTAGSAASFVLLSYGNVTIQANILGGGGTLVVETSMDGGTFWSRPNIFQPGTQNYVNGFTSPFICTLCTTGLTNIRVRAITSWSGTATILVRESINPRNMTIIEALPPGANTIGSISNVSGTISLPTGAATSANQTTEIASLQSIDNPVGSVAAGTAGTSSYLIGGVFNTSLPTLTTGQQAAVQMDSSGRLIIAPLTISSKTPLSAASPAAATVGITSASAVATNANRKGLVLTNTSKNTISFGLGVAAVLNEGITLLPGGLWEMDEYTFTTAAVNAIASAASSNLAIQEFS